MAVASTAPVEDDRTARRIGVSVDAAVVPLPVVVVDRTREAEPEAFCLFDELLTPAAPRVPVVVGPGGVRRVLLRDGPVRCGQHVRRRGPSLAVPAVGIGRVTQAGVGALPVLGHALAADVDTAGERRRDTSPAV